MNRLVALLVCFLLVFAAGTDGMAKAKKKKARKKKAKASSSVTVPVQLGVGPSLNMITGLVADDQMFHYGLKTYLAAVLSHDWLVSHKGMIPKKYRGQALKQDEMRITPMIAALLPDSLIISPKTRNTGVFGVTFRPLHLGIAPISSSRVRLGLSAGLILTYLYLTAEPASGIPVSSLHFFRPGADLNACLEIKISEGFLFSIGWASQFHIPQSLEEGASFTDVSMDNSIWHIGQAYALLNFRFPYDYSF